MNARPAATSQHPIPAGSNEDDLPPRGSGGRRAGPPLSQSLRPRGPVELRVSHYERADATVVTAAGELDILTAPKFSAKIDELVRRRAGDIVVDLSEVQFVDSAGLQVLLSAHRRLTRRGRRFTVICPTGPALRAIELARLTGVLAVVSSFNDYEAHSTGPSA